MCEVIGKRIGEAFREFAEATDEIIVYDNFEAIDNVLLTYRKVVDAVLDYVRSSFEPDAIGVPLIKNSVPAAITAPIRDATEFLEFVLQHIKSNM